MTDIEFGNGVLEELDSLDPGSAQASDPDVSMTSDAGGEAYGMYLYSILVTIDDLDASNSPVQRPQVLLATR